MASSPSLNSTFPSAAHIQKALEPTILSCGGKSTDSSAPQSSKALPGISTIAFGKITLRKLVHPLKVSSPMLLTDSGMTIWVKDMHHLKQYGPIYSRASGKFTLRNLWHPLNAACSITSRPLPKAISRRSKAAKASFPMLLTESGIMISTRDWQLSKQASPIVIRVSGKLTTLSSGHSAKARFSMISIPLLKLTSR